jgi:uncharacterized membrane protein YgcG
MRRHFWLGLLLALLVALVSWGAAQAQDKSLYWQRYDVNITVQPNSDVLVEEIQQIQFTSGDFHFGYRAIPLDRVDQITDVSVAEVINGSERPYASGSTGEYGFTASTEEGKLKITWYFPYTRNTAHTYIVRYRVVGGLRIYEGGDQIWWKAIGADHNFPIRASKVTVSLPATFSQDQLKVESYGASARNYVTDRGAVVFEAQNIAADQELEVRVQFPHGVVQGSAPAWQAADDQRQQWGPVVSVIFGGLGLVLLVGGPLAVYLLWYTRGRDLPMGLVAEYITEPPSDLPAGIVGTLVDEKADMKDIIASLVDLARRGAIRMEEERREGFLGIGSGSDFVFHLEDARKAIRPYEQTLIERIFGGRSERRMSDLREKFYTAIPELNKQLYEEIVKEGFFPRSPKATRRLWMGMGGAGVIVSGIIGFCLLGVLGGYSPWAICPAMALGITMVGLMVTGGYMPRKTAKGVEEATKWLAFKRYLQTIEKHGDLAAAKDKFEEFLPYAIAFGIERSLINKFAAIDAPAPSWWGPVFVPGHGYGHAHDYGGGMAGQSVGRAGGPPGTLAGEGGKAPSLSGMSQSIGTSLASMSVGLGAMLSSASHTLASAPSSSSGGGGWSGGGFGGGGGGGGGSSSFG